MPNSDIQSPSVSEQPAMAAAAPVSRGVLTRIRLLFNAARRLHEREKSRVRNEIAQVPGLMSLLMKPRNGQKWSRAERIELRGQLHRLSRLGLYLATAALPGTSLTLPLLAWWLDRRRRRRTDTPANGATS